MRRSADRAIAAAGDAALVVELPARIDPAINERRAALAAASRRQSAARSSRVVVGYCSVTVYFDPLARRRGRGSRRRSARSPADADAADRRRAERRSSTCRSVTAATSARTSPTSRRSAQCSEDEVVALHLRASIACTSSASCPGFAYMAEVDPRIAAPRRHDAADCGAGGVGGDRRRADRHLSGGDTRRLEHHRPDAAQAVRSDAAEPFLFQRRSRAVRTRSRATNSDDRDVSVMSLTVVRAGMLTTVQDLGRWGHQAAGVPVAGPMDAYSHRLANRLVGNDDGAAALEITLIGPELEATVSVVCVVAGARVRADGQRKPVAGGQPFRRCLPARGCGSARVAGARATLAVRGGFDVPPRARQPRDEPRQPHGSVRRPRAHGRRRAADRPSRDRRRGRRRPLSH